ncbi:unnamed protein product, partial [Polarella glacialis]
MAISAPSWSTKQSRPRVVQLAPAAPAPAGSLPDLAPRHGDNNNNTANNNKNNNNKNNKNKNNNNNNNNKNNKNNNNVTAPRHGDFTAAIAACGRASEWRAALQLLAKSFSDGGEPHIVPFTQAISACRARKDEEASSLWLQSLVLLADARQRRLRLSVITLNSAMSACERCGQWQAALELFEATGCLGLETWS